MQKRFEDKVALITRSLHNPMKIATFCNVWDNNLAHFSTMSLGSAVLN